MACTWSHTFLLLAHTTLERAQPHRCANEKKKKKKERKKQRAVSSCPSRTHTDTHKGETVNGVYGRDGRARVRKTGSTSATIEHMLSHMLPSSGAFRCGSVPVRERSVAGVIRCRTVSLLNNHVAVTPRCNVLTTAFRPSSPQTYRRRCHSALHWLALRTARRSSMPLQAILPARRNFWRGRQQLSGSGHRSRTVRARTISGCHTG